MKALQRTDSSAANPAAASEPQELLVLVRRAAVNLVEQLQALRLVRAADLPSLWAEHIAAVQEVIQFLDSDGTPVPDSRRCPPMTDKQKRMFGRLLRDKRNAAGLSRLQLARKAQLSDATIKFIETARNPPSRASLIRLINVPALSLRWADVPGQPSLSATAGILTGADRGLASAVDALMVVDRMDFDELGDPVFVRRLVCAVPEQSGTRLHEIDFVPLRR